MKHVILIVLLIASALSAKADAADVDALTMEQGQTVRCVHSSGCIVFTQDDLRKWLAEIEAEAAKMCKRGSV